MAKLRSIFKKHLIPNLESKCRLCLSDRAIVQSIFQSENSKEATATLVEKIFECTAIMLSKDFDFPSPICEDCAQKLDEFLLFRTKCLRSNEIYRFNRLHKQRMLFCRPVGSEKKSPPEANVVDGKPDTESSSSSEELRPTEAQCVQMAQVIPVVIVEEASGSSSSEHRTVIDTEQITTRSDRILEPEITTCSVLSNGANTEQSVPEEQSEMDSESMQSNNRMSPSTLEQTDEQLILRWKPPLDPEDSECSSMFSPAPVVFLVDETETTTSEVEDIEEVMLLPSEQADSARKSDFPLDPVGDVTFPIETVEQLEQLEQLVRSSDSARNCYINTLRRLKSHDCSLSTTYQRLFADKLLIHYNYDGISPKYNKRSLKSLHLFTECMVVAWEDHMDAGKVKEAVIQAVRKSHNRYNQFNHRKLRVVIADDNPLKGDPSWKDYQLLPANVHTLVP
ncbi:uncharacterized protein LOC128722801 [Anopheles nili]|uniref:uncharacterized protein LOC128722801 n=1 Tax=Anopheles nili TaxID=185578 RepID=UPI00237AD7A3|nr:uncharacterized protein LOC128722801 [Anopheles nili]